LSHGLVSRPVILLLWHDELHHVLALDDGRGDRHNRVAVTEELDPQIGGGKPSSLLRLALATQLFFNFEIEPTLTSRMHPLSVIVRRTSCWIG
jgi:hypothetical protein